jgi:hypothetical protein
MALPAFAYMVLAWSITEVRAPRSCQHMGAQPSFMMTLTCGCSELTRR